MNANCYTRPDKSRNIKVTRREIEVAAYVPPSIPQPVIVHASTECHVTPAAVAERMAEYLGHVEWLLEPSAGTGNLVIAASYGKIVIVERSQDLCAVIHQRAGLFPVCSDFLDWDSDILFDGVLMNPPFSKTKAHVLRAFSMLSPGGSLVAIVPITFDEKVIQAEVVEVLSQDTFFSCRVSTKIILAHK